jgi:hypothetical protein
VALIHTQSRGDIAVMLRFLFALVLFSLAALAVPALTNPARADNACIDRCFSTFSPSQMDGSTELRDECLQQCKAPSLLYGAIAYGARSTANGYAFDKNNMADAIHTAMANCQVHGDDCKIVASFSNSCAAVAAVESKGVYSVAEGKTKAQSQSGALKVCTRAHGKGCEIEVWTCAN